MSKKTKVDGKKKNAAKQIAPATENLIEKKKITAL